MTGAISVLCAVKIDRRAVMREFKLMKIMVQLSSDCVTRSMY